MTTKSEYESMIDQCKFYTQQVNQSKALVELNGIYGMTNTNTRGIGFILNYVFYEIIMSAIST